MFGQSDPLIITGGQAKSFLGPAVIKAMNAPTLDDPARQEDYRNLLITLLNAFGLNISPDAREDDLRAPLEAFSRFLSNPENEELFHQIRRAIDEAQNPRVPDDPKTFSADFRNRTREEEAIRQRLGISPEVWAKHNP